MAGMRKKFPDAERGVAHVMMVQMGINPPGIPAPAAFQPLWSGAPIRSMNSDKEFMDLGLDKIFVPVEEEED